MEFRILGPLEVERDGQILSLGTGRQLALVAALLLHRNEVVSVDRLVDELWEMSPPPTAAKIVRNNVSLLRKELGDRLETRAPGYLLRVEPGELDSDRFEQAVARGEPAELESVLGLWRGAPLAEFAYERFAQHEIARLEELRLLALESLIDADLAQGRHLAVIPELERLAREHPLRERLQAQLMLALYRSGRQADALDAYRRARRALDEGLGIEPGPALRELEQQILNQDESLGAPSLPLSTRLRTRRRLGLALVALALGAAGITVAVALATRDAMSDVVVPPNYVGAIEAATGALTRAVPVGVEPGPIAARDNVVWVGNRDDRTLTRIDAARGTTVATVSLDGRTPTAVAIGRNAIWVAHGRRGELSKVEPQFGQITPIGVTQRPYAAPYGSVAVGDGAIWAVFGDSTLARIGESGTHVDGTALTGASSSAVVVGGGAVWVANAGDATVERFNPATFDEGEIAKISVGRRPVALAYGHRAVWVVNQADDTVARVDPGTNANVFTVRVGDRPIAVAVTSDAVWVANAGDGTVSRIDPETNDVTRTIEIGGTPAGIAAAGGLVWVSVAR